MLSAAGSASNPNPHHERIEMIVYGVLIEHPTSGLLLFETGCHDDMEKHWGPVSSWMSPQARFVTFKVEKY